MSDSRGAASPAAAAPRGFTVFARFHARPGREAALAAAIRTVVAATRAEAGNIGIGAFRSLRDGALFYIHSQWLDEAAFDLHAGLPHTAQFLENIRPLIDHELDVARTVEID